MTHAPTPLWQRVQDSLNRQGMMRHLEARLWNDVFRFAEKELGIPHGTIRATVLVEGGVTAVTPATLRGLPEGQLNILLKMERYRDTEDEIRVEAGEPQKFVIEMENAAAYGSIKIELYSNIAPKMERVRSKE